uniref:Ig-like domain-containing protein n=1 Tax=Strigops habroptila TaxID=2489341 RepID=A0A672UMP0_STRHB
MGIPMAFSTLLLLLAAIPGLRAAVTLVETGGDLQSPGGSLTLVCKASGFTLSSYNMGWARQAPGQGLEWVASISTGGSTYYAPSVKGRFTISRDTSQSTVTLQMSSLTTDDTATYYCAKAAHGTDAWGSGTIVTVSSESAAAPNVYPLVPCDCTEPVSIGCLAKDFFPTPISITWVSEVDGDNETFPIQLIGSSYSVSSQLTISSSVKGETFQCQVDHSITQSSTTETFVGDDLCSASQLSIRLFADPNQKGSEKEVLLLCLVEGKGAEEAKVEWLESHEALEAEQEDVACEQCGGDVATSVRSTVNVSRDKWDAGTEFSCRVSHSSLETPEVLNISTFCLDVKPEVEVVILPPALEDLYLKQNSTITCVVLNLKSTEDVAFSWSRDKGSPLDVTTGEVEKLPNGLNGLSSSLKICAEEWNSGETFSCSVNVPELQEPITRSIKKDTDTTAKAPSVYVLPPPADELVLQETATLTCLATGFSPKDILVTWTQQDRPVSSESFSTFGPKAEGDAFTVYSMLKVPVDEWQRGDTFSCVVGHDGIPLTFIQKNLDKTLGKPTMVNVSVVLSDSEVTCY